ncbi:sulfatase [Saltatorellus ferox]
MLRTLFAPFLLLAASLPLLGGCGGVDEPATSGSDAGVSRAADGASGEPGSERSGAAGDALRPALESAPPLEPLPTVTFADGMLQAVNLYRDARKGVMLTEKGQWLDIGAAEAPKGQTKSRALELRFEVSSAVPVSGEERGLWDPELNGPDLLVSQEGVGGEPLRVETQSSWRTVTLPLEGTDATRVFIAFEKEIDPARPTWISEPWVAFREPSRAKGAEARPRTVLLITSDTHRADHVSALDPSSPVATPYLDSLAGEGAIFTDCFAAINNTNPSHISLMTGLHPRDVKIVNNNTRLSRDADTLAERFNAQGYRCYAALSAFHLFDQLSGLGQGFHRMNAAFPTERDGAETLDLAASWLEDSGDAPVFLWIHLFDVHSPYKIHRDQKEELLSGRPSPYRKEVSLGIEPARVPDWLKNAGIRDPSFVNAMYAGEVRYLDGRLGPFMQTPRTRDAIVAFTADHGEGLGEQSTFWTHFGVLTSTVHVPLILRGPGVPPGTRVKAPTEMLDVGKTLLRMAGAEDEGFPGEDLRELFTHTPPPEPRFALAAHGLCASIESEGWLLQMFLKRAVNRSSGLVHEVGSVGFFRLSDDPHCENNVLLEHFPRAMRMRSALERWLAAAVPMGLHGASDMTREEEAKLAAMGYASGGESLMRWWAPEFTDLEWDKSPWRLAFEGDGAPELLKDALVPDFAPVKDGK